MGEIDRSSTAQASLRLTFEGAKRFGLTDDEVWRTLDESLHEADGDATVSEFLDRLTAALAERVLAKTRRTLAGEQRTRSKELR